VKGGAELGVELVMASHDMQGFRKAIDSRDGADVLLLRWFGEYDDPDAYTHAVFHSAHGYLRNHCSSPELDKLLDEARFEAQPAQRAARYRALEARLLEEHWVLPLFHDIDCRLHLPTLENVSLGPTPPFVGYASLRKIQTSGAAPSQQTRRGTVHLSTVCKVDELDPRTLLLAEHADVAGAVFETLTREGRGALVVPWLAEHFESEDGGRRYRFRLRDNVRFHDGRKLTSRDVRYTLESFLAFERSSGRVALADIRGAKDVIAGRTRELAGFQIASPLEFTIELEQPLGILPALLTTGQVSIVPEGASGGTGNWRSGLVGTGPFRIERLEAGRRLELEANPHYWRPGLPRAEAFVVHLGVSVSDAVARFRAGQLSIVSQVAPADFDALLRDPACAAGFHEIPELSTAALFFNTHQGVFRDAEVRRRVAHAIDVPSLGRHLGRRAARARSFLPPGLVHEGVMAEPAATGPDTEFTAPLEVTCLVTPNFEAKHPAVARELLAQLARARVKLKTELGVLEAGRSDFDLYLGWWVADYPDADTFMALLHSTGEYGHFASSPELDRLVERSRMESDPRVRRALFRDFEEFLAREALLVPLCHENRYSFARPEVRGVSDDFLQMTIGRDYATLWIAE
jgi:oligopeptide transport system substrate-binding protein